MKLSHSAKWVQKDAISLNNKLLISLSQILTYRITQPVQLCETYVHIIIHKYHTSFILFIFKDFIYFWEGEGGREGEREKEKHQCVVVSRISNWGPGSQPSHVPWLGIEPATLWFAGLHSIHWATPVRTTAALFKHPKIRNTQIKWIKSVIY